MSNDLIPILSRPVGDETNSVDARELHRVLCVGRDFPTWMRSRIDSLELVENVDYCAIIHPPDPGNGRPMGRTEYAITIDAAKHIALAERTDAGKRVRAYFIEAEKRLRAAPVDPMAMLADPAHLRALLLSYAERTSQAEAALAAAAPKVEVYDRVIESGDTFGFRQAAQQVRAATGANEAEVRTRMLALGWIQRIDKRIAPRAYGMDRGYVTTRETTWTDDTGVTHVKPELRVTPKGIARLVEMLLEEAA